MSQYCNNVVFSLCYVCMPTDCPYKRTAASRSVRFVPSFVGKKNSWQKNQSVQVPHSEVADNKERTSPYRTVRIRAIVPVVVR